MSQPVLTPEDLAPIAVTLAAENRVFMSIYPTALLISCPSPPIVATASLFGDVFDDAATGQGLLNFFLRGIACGARSPRARRWKPA